jgi:serine/threonine protein kinase
VSLQAAVARAGTFSVGETAAVGVQVADGLARAAAVGLVHRDIKPANLLVDRRGGVKILDLGIVRFTHDDTFSRTHGAEVILGTLDYLAPEQAEDSSRVDTRADLYALGATLYFLLAGHPPFPGSDVRRKLMAKRNEDPPAIHQLRPDVSDEFSAVVQRLLARAPTDRYPTPAVVVAALHPWVAPGTDFPARLFRLSSDSTAHERRHTDHQVPSDSMPDTLRIIKPIARPAPVESGGDGALGSGPPGTSAPPPVGATDGAAPPTGEPISIPPPTEEGFEARSGDTDCVSAGGALTDEALAVPPELLILPDLSVLAARGARALPAGDSATVSRPQTAAAPTGLRWRIAVGLVLAALALSAGAAALIWLAGR